MLANSIFNLVVVSHHGSNLQLHVLNLDIVPKCGYDAILQTSKTFIWWHAVADSNL